MTVRTAERRRSVRLAAAYPAIVRDRRGRILARGRTANISEKGVFVIARRRAGPPPPQEDISVELTIPAARTLRSRRQAVRTVRYRGRIARTQPIGQLIGLGIEFLEKLR